MTEIDKKIIDQYGKKLRIRVCGICIDENKILLVRHQMGQKNDTFWSPPGGGMVYGQSAEQNLKREFLEETGLTIDVDRFLFIHEFLAPPLHAVELFFEVRITGGELKVGIDPEMSTADQIIREVRFVDFGEITRSEKKHYHNIFTMADSDEKILQLKGYYHCC